VVGHSLTDSDALTSPIRRRLFRPHCFVSPDYFGIFLVLDGRLLFRIENNNAKFRLVNMLTDASVITRDVPI